MDFNGLVIYLTDFYYQHTIVAITLAVVLLLLVCFRPKAMLKTFAILLVFIIGIYFCMLAVDMAKSGRMQKKEMIQTVD
jgi:hypothetical protein